MQQPSGDFKFFKDLEVAQEASKKKEKETGKPHPVFFRGEILEIRGGKFKVLMILKDRLILRPIPY